MNRLKGKRALITGGTSGIGLETARLFINEGARVAISGQSTASVEGARAELGSEVFAFASDSSDVAQQKELAKKVADAFGQIEILVINAGIAELKPVGAWDEAARTGRHRPPRPRHPQRPPAGGGGAEQVRGHELRRDRRGHGVLDQGGEFIA